MAKQSARGYARRELVRAKGNLEDYAVHVQRVVDSHHGKGYPDIDQALDLIRDLIGQAATLHDWLHERL